MSNGIMGAANEGRKKKRKMKSKAPKLYGKHSGKSQRAYSIKSS